MSSAGAAAVWVRRASPALVLALGLAAPPSAAAAQDCAGEVGARIAFLESALEQDERYADLWWHAWNAGFGIGITLDGVRIATADDRGERANHVAGLVKAGIGLTRNLVSPPGARDGAAAMQQLGLDCRERLLRGEAALRRNAAETREERYGWKSHVGNLAMNLAHGLIVGEGFDEGSGWGSAAIGLVFGEIRIWTHPFQAPKRLEAYERRFPERVQSSGRDVVWHVEPWRGGARVVVGF